MLCFKVDQSTCGKIWKGLGKISKSHLWQVDVLPTHIWKLQLVVEVPKDDGRLFHTPKSLQKKHLNLSTLFGVSRSQTSVVKTLLIFCRSFMASASSAVYAGHPTSKKLLLCHGKRDAAVKVFLYSMMYFSTRLQIDKLVRRFGNSRALVKLFLNISNFKLTEIDWSRYQLCCILATCSFSR